MSELEDTVRVEVKTLPSGSYIVNVPRSIDISGLKDRLVEDTTVPANRQRLLYMGRELPNSETLSNLIPTANSLVLHMVQRPRPEGAAPMSGLGTAPGQQTAGFGNPMAGIQLGPNVTINGAPVGGGPPGGAAMGGGPIPFSMLPPEIQQMLSGAGGPSALGGDQVDGRGDVSAAVLGPFTMDGSQNPAQMMAQITEMGNMFSQQINGRMRELLPQIPPAPRRQSSSRSASSTTSTGTPTTTTTTTTTGANTSGNTNNNNSTSTRASRPRHRHFFDGLDRLLLRLENLNMDPDPMNTINAAPQNAHRDPQSSSRWSSAIASFVRSTRPILAGADGALPDTTIAAVNRVYAAARVPLLNGNGVRSFPVTVEEEEATAATGGGGSDEEFGGILEEESSVDEQSPQRQPRGNTNTTAGSQQQDNNNTSTPTSTTTARGQQQRATRPAPPTNWHLAVSEDDLLAVAAASTGVLLHRFLGTVLGSGAQAAQSNALALGLADRLMAAADLQTERQDLLRNIGMAASYLYRVASVSAELSRNLQYLGSAIDEGNPFIYEARSGYIHLEGRRPYPYVPRPLRPDFGIAVMPSVAIGSVEITTGAEGGMEMPMMGAPLPGTAAVNVQVHTTTTTGGEQPNTNIAGSETAQGNTNTTAEALFGDESLAEVGRMLSTMDSGGVSDLVQRVSGMANALSSVSVRSLDIPTIASEIATNLQGTIQAAATEYHPGETPRDAARAAGELANQLGPRIASQVTAVLGRHLNRIREMPEVQQFEEELRQLNMAVPSGVGSDRAPAAAGTHEAAGDDGSQPVAVASESRTTAAATSTPDTNTPTSATEVPTPATAPPTTTTTTGAGPSLPPRPAPSRPPAAGLGLGGGLKPRGGPSALPPRSSTTATVARSTSTTTAGATMSAQPPTTTSSSQQQQLVSRPPPASRQPTRTGSALSGGGSGGLASLMSGLMDNPEIMQAASSPAMQAMAQRMMGDVQSGRGLDLGALMNAAGPMLGSLMGGGSGSSGVQRGGSAGQRAGAAASSANVAIDVNEALSALDAEDADLWRMIIEGDVVAQENMPSQGEFSEAYDAVRSSSRSGGGGVMDVLLGL